VRIRLACTGCDRDDHDGSTIDAASSAGWEAIVEVQTFEQSEEVHDRHGGYIDWWTHLGDCPDCIAEEPRESAAMKQRELFK
jgi:hypothetical protein